MTLFLFALQTLQIRGMRVRWECFFVFFSAMVCCFRLSLRVLSSPTTATSSWTGSLSTLRTGRKSTQRSRWFQVRTSLVTKVGVQSSSHTTSHRNQWKGPLSLPPQVWWRRGSSSAWLNEPTSAWRMEACRFEILQSTEEFVLIGLSPSSWNDLHLSHKCHVHDSHPPSDCVGTHDQMQERIAWFFSSCWWCFSVCEF